VGEKSVSSGKFACGKVVWNGRRLLRKLRVRVGGRDVALRGLGAEEKERASRRKTRRRRHGKSRDARMDPTKDF